MSELKQISISIEHCCKAILKELNGEADPRRKEIILIQCEKFNLKEEFIKKLLFIDDERAKKRAYKQKRHHEKNKKFLN